MTRGRDRATCDDRGRGRYETWQAEDGRGTWSSPWGDRRRRRRHLHLHPARRPDPDRQARSTTGSSCSRHAAPRRTRWRPRRACRERLAGDLGALRGRRLRARWHLGFLDPRRQYVAVEQCDEAAGEVHRRRPARARRRRRPPSAIDGQTWTALRGRPVRRAGARGARASTTVVTGTASFAQLRRWPQALEDGAAAAQG